MAEQERPIEDIKAAYAFRETIPPDGMIRLAPFWYGHAIYRAYWAGLEAGRKENPTDGTKEPNNG